MLTDASPLTHLSLAHSLPTHFTLLDSSPHSTHSLTHPLTHSLTLLYLDSSPRPTPPLQPLPLILILILTRLADWNTPKHLARFDWHFGPGGAVTVKVYPHDTHGDASEAQPSAVPFFQATWAPIRFVPAFPFATGWVNRLGLNTTLVMPPLPRGQGSRGELPGTDAWCSLVPNQYSRRTRLGWFDIAQPEAADDDAAPEHYPNFWPGLRRWQLGLKMENADLRFDLPIDVWRPQRANL